MAGIKLQPQLNFKVLPVRPERAVLDFINLFFVCTERPSHSGPLSLIVYNSGSGQVTDLLG